MQLDENSSGFIDAPIDVPFSCVFFWGGRGIDQIIGWRLGKELEYFFKM